MKPKCISHYHFLLEWGGKRDQFSEVSGLDMNIGLNSFREGSSKLETKEKMPGLVRYYNLTLKRVIVHGGINF